MSTLFSIYKKPSPENHTKMSRMLKDKQYKSLQNLLNDTVSETSLGLRSCGNQFLFYPGPWGYTLSSINQYLRTSNYTILDEYGKIYSPDEFWIEIKDSIYTGEKPTKECVRTSENLLFKTL